MGCYPLFACADWSRLHVDLDALPVDLVSLAIVADPFGGHDFAYLRACFRDLVLPFKDHLVVDLSVAPESFVDPHHRRNARKALGYLDVEVCEDPMDFLNEWKSLYANLVRRHRIEGLTAFSATTLSKQLTVPGIKMLRAVHGHETVGITLWYADTHVAYYHLGAYSDDGYRLRASFALFWRAIEYFAALHMQWLNLGAGAGLAREPHADGLTRFKRGWASGTRTAYFCGRIFDQHKYADTMRALHMPASEYFPAYRAGEFR